MKDAILRAVKKAIKKSAKREASIDLPKDIAYSDYVAFDLSKVCEPEPQKRPLRLTNAGDAWTPETISTN